MLKTLYAKAGFADAFAIDLPSNATGDAERLATHMLMGQARWVGWLVALRDTLVAGFGLETSSELRWPGEGDAEVAALIQGVGQRTLTRFAARLVRFLR